MITNYFSLSLNERINLRSGFDIAVARESGVYNRFAKCVSMQVNTKACQREYGIDRFYCSLRTLLHKKAES